MLAYPLLAAAAALLHDATAQETTVGGGEQDRGPAAMWFPPDREWGAPVDNNAPCGSSQGPMSMSDRSEFPLTGGKITLIMRDDAYNVTVSVSYSDNPQNNEDFEELISPTREPEVDPGHACFDLPDADSGTQIDQLATLQLKYVSDLEDNINKTFYACSDIKYVEEAQFDKASYMCFNASTDDPEDFTSHPNVDETGVPSPEPQTDSNEDGDSGLSGGAIAGIVVGVIVGIAILLGAGWLLHRRRVFRAKQDATAGYRMDALKGGTAVKADAASDRTDP